MNADEDLALKLKDLLFQCESMQHQRVYFFLVAEAIFFAAAAQSFNNWIALATFALSGFAVSIVFTIINFKNYFRIMWLMEHLMSVDPLVRKYIRYENFKAPNGLSGLTACAYDVLIYDATASDPLDKPRRPKRTDTGILFCWGLFFIINITWILLLLNGFLHAFINEFLHPCS